MVGNHKFDSVFDGHLPDFEYPSIEEDITFGISICTYYKKNGETWEKDKRNRKKNGGRGFKGSQTLFQG